MQRAVHERHAPRRQLLLGARAPARRSRSDNQDLENQVRGLPAPRSQGNESRSGSSTRSSCGLDAAEVAASTPRRSPRGHRQRGVELRVDVSRSTRARSDGIAVDMPVVTGTADGAILVGRVVEVASRIASQVQLIIDRNFSVAAASSAARGRTAWCRARATTTCRWDSCRPGHGRSTGERARLHAGLLRGGPARAVPARPADRPGVPHGSGRQALSRRRERAPGRRFRDAWSSCWCSRPGRTARDRGASSRVAAVILTALLLQSTVFAQIRLLGVKPELMYLVTISSRSSRALRRAPSSGSRAGWPRTSC